MAKILAGLLLGLGALVLVAVLSVLGGTIVWFLWPSAVMAFPALVKSGALASNISWWTAVSLTYVMAILVKASQTNNNKDCKVSQTNNNKDCNASQTNNNKD